MTPASSTAPADLLARISAEIAQRLAELQPALAEYDELLGAVDALASGSDGTPPQGAQEPSEASSPRGAAARALTRAARQTNGSAPRRRALAAARSRRRSPQRRQPDATERAVLAALEHGSHTVGELVLVTAMPIADIRQSVKRLRSAGTVARAEREGRTAYALSAAAG